MRIPHNESMAVQFGATKLRVVYPITLRYGSWMKKIVLPNITIYNSYFLSLFFFSHPLVSLGVSLSSLLSCKLFDHQSAIWLLLWWSTWQVQPLDPEVCMCQPKSSSKQMRINIRKYLKMIIFHQYQMLACFWFVWKGSHQKFHDFLGLSVNEKITKKATPVQVLNVWC